MSDLVKSSSTNNLPMVLRRTNHEEVETNIRDKVIVYPTHHKIEGGIMERGFRFSDDFSAGTFNEIYIDGAHIFFNDLSVFKTRIVKAEIIKPVIQMYFLLAGDNSITVGKNLSVGRILKNQHNLFYRPIFKGEYILEGKKFQNFGIQLSEKFFGRLLDVSSKSINNILEGIRNESEFVKLSNMNLTITPAMKAIIYDIINTNRSGYMKRLYLESKIIELFMLQVEQADNISNGKTDKFKKEDIDRIHDAKSFIEQNMLDEFTLLDLSRKIGLNDFKLKRGFKELFGTTVFSYLSELKMDYAKRLLLDEKKTIAETAMILNYSEPHHFSAAFKRKFGYSPGELK